MDIVAMSKEELRRLEVMQKLAEKQLRQKTAAGILGISVRQVKRLLRAYRREGTAGLVSKQRGKPSHHQLDRETERAALDLLKGRYADFGPTLAHEKLVEREGLNLSLGSVRRLMIVEGLWKAKTAHKSEVHPMRERRACIGELVQMDGTDHDWFEGRSERCTLLVMIDDATGQLGALAFVEEESFFGYCGELLRQYLGLHGRPGGLYTDKHGIFRVNLPVERVNETLQDRLVKEMRLRGIDDPQQGNAYLPEFIVDFNARFAVQPRSSLDAHRPVLPTHKLDQIFTWQETRSLSKNLTLQFKQVVYQIHTDRPAYALQKAPVVVCQDALGKITLLYKGAPLKHSLFHRQARQSEVVTAKQVDHLAINQSKAHKPSPHHPWYRTQSPLSPKKGDIPIQTQTGDILIKP
jgi:transposase